MRMPLLGTIGVWPYAYAYASLAEFSRAFKRVESSQESTGELLALWCLPRDGVFVAACSPLAGQIADALGLSMPSMKTCFKLQVKTCFKLQVAMHAVVCMHMHAPLSMHRYVSTSKSHTHAHSHADMHTHAHTYKHAHVHV